MIARKPGPPRTGCVEPFKGADGRTYFRARIRLADHSRVRVDVPAKHAVAAGGISARARAELYAETLQEREDEQGEKGELLALKRAGKLGRASVSVGASTGETCNQWFERYTAYQKECGNTDPTKHGRWLKWISPRIGLRPITSITRDDVEDIRDALDVAVRAWATEGRGEDRISGKTAMNVWSALTSAFKAAVGSKRRDLRVLADRPNPCLGVEPPGDRNSRKARRKPFVYPKECAELLACKEVPREWREVHAIAAYTYLRPGELRVLTWSDVDLDAGLIHVTKAWDYTDEIVKAPKTRNGVRRVPIEPTLVPLLRRMHEGKPDDAPVVPVLSSFRGGWAAEDQLALVFRKHLALAKIDRAALHTTTATHVKGNFRSWRDSGLTWLAMSGLGVDKILRRAGHDDINTTMGYVKQAEDLTGDLGTPFAPLPDELVGAPVIGPAPTRGGGARGRGRVPRSGPLTRPTFRGTPKKAGDLVRTKGLETPCIVQLTETTNASSETESTGVDPSPRNLDDTGPSGPVAECTRSGEGSEGVDLDRAEALASAVVSLLVANLAVQARPLAEELAALIKAARGPSADVIDLATRRPRR